jgi:ribonuclease R
LDGYKVLGKPGQHDTEIHAILAEYGLPSEFPIEVETFAQKIDTSITESEIANRRDMRDTLTFIDPKMFLMMPYHLKTR